MKTEGYDLLTLELSKSDALAAHLRDRLEHLSDAEPGGELYALSLVANTIQEQNARARDQAEKLFSSKGGAR